MKAINRKLWRDLNAARGQALAISLVIACGLAILCHVVRHMGSARKLPQRLL